MKLKSIKPVVGEATSINPEKVVKVVSKPPGAEILIEDGVVIETSYTYADTVKYLQS